MSNVISIISDDNGNLIGHNDLSPLFQLALSKINVNFFEKKLLANMLDKNYTVYRLPLFLNNKKFTHWIFEEWKIDNNVGASMLYKNIFIKQQLKIIHNFSEFEQEIIYSLLSGYLIDKEIEIYLEAITKQKVKGNIRYAISRLYNKFNCGTRTALVYLLKAHELHAFLPATLFPCGEYSLRK